MILLALLAAALIVAFLLALAGIPVLALLCQITWPLLHLLHLVRARLAVRREFPRAFAQWTPPSVR